MDIEKLTSLLKDASQTGVEELCIVGSGEPTLYPYYRQAIAQAKELRLRVNLSTNGVLLNEELCDFLIEQNVDHITISFSGPSLKSWQDNHPLSNKTQYKKVLQNIELLSRKKRQSGSISPNLEILHVIHKHSYDQMLPMITQCRQLGADAVWFQLLHCFDFNSHLAMDEEQILELKRYYEEALLLANNLDIKVNQNLKYQINRLKNDGTWATDLFEKTGCLVGWIFCYINVAFEVNFCCGVKSMAALEQSFSSLWNSSLYKQWRTCARNFDLKNSPTGIHGKSLLDTFCKSCDNLNFQFEMLGLIERAGLKEFYRTYQ
jgi:MoaA/NifB/PqqE/SkfB family radical SAM enzyme